MSSVPPPSGRSLFGLEANVAGMLCYAPCCIGLVFSILVAAMEKRQRALRFHAFQSLMLYGVEIAVGIVMWIVGLILAQIAGVLDFLATMVSGMIGLAVLVIQVLLMVKTYNREEIELPVLGDLARKQL
jgi:uncharacterized membrane protein